MNPLHEIDCRSARAAVSARFDGEPADERELLHHLHGCAPCRDFEASLAGFSAGWAALRDVAPPPTLGARIQARVAAQSARRRPNLALQLAAGVAGFALVGIGVWWVEQELSTHAAPAQWVESLTPITQAPESSAIFASVPEYQLLVGFPRTEEER